MCGNTVIAKPSEMTSVTAWMMCKLLDKAGNPKIEKVGKSLYGCVVYFNAKQSVKMQQYTAGTYIF